MLRFSRKLCDFSFQAIQVIVESGRKEYKILVGPSTTFGEFKDIFEFESSESPQIFKFKGRLLMGDSKKLKDFRIQDGSRIQHSTANGKV